MYVNSAYISVANAVPGQTVVNTSSWTDVVPASGIVVVEVVPSISCGRINLRADFIVI